MCQPGDNLPLAWEALKNRYENRRMLVDNQVQILLNLPKVYPETSEAIQKLQSTVNNCLSILKTQNVDTDSWDPILIHLCCSKLSDTTISLWEQSLTSRKELPLWSQLDNFLTTRYEVVERLQSMHVSTPKTQFQNVQSNSKPQWQQTHQNKFSKPSETSYHSQGKIHMKCKICKQEHPLRNCSKFKSLSPQERLKIVRENNMCENCLAYTHARINCLSKFTCSICQKRHHTMLHIVPKQPHTKTNSQLATTTNSNSSDSEAPCCSNAATQAYHASNHEKTLLPTAIVTIEHEGELFTLRALIDQGSQRTFLASKVQNRLQIPYENSNFEISGMGGSVVQRSKKMCTLKIVKPNQKERIITKAIVLSQLTQFMPQFTVSKNIWSELGNITLADPNCNKPAKIDIVLGSDVIPQIMQNGIKTVAKTLLAQNTIFGWIISGPVRGGSSGPAPQRVSAYSANVELVSNETLSTQLRQFWEQEEIPQSILATPKDDECETLYKATTTRQPPGRYVVRLPFKKNFPKELSLDHSRISALQQFYGMERTLTKKGEVKNTYDDGVEEYLKLDHNCQRIVIYLYYKTICLMWNIIFLIDYE